MKNQSHSWQPRRIIVVLLAVAIVSFIALSRFPSMNLAQNQSDDPQAKAANVDKTLSPYFFVQGDPSVDQLPLKDTHVDIAVSGVIADVKVVQTYRNEGSRPINATVSDAFAVPDGLSQWRTSTLTTVPGTASGPWPSAPAR